MTSEQIPQSVIDLIESLRRRLPTLEDLQLDAIGNATSEDEFNAAWQSWYFGEGM